MRTLFQDPDLRTVTIVDDRFYTRDMKTWSPSVTTILDGGYPMSDQFVEWLKIAGPNASYVVERAAEVGSKVHQGIEYMLNGVPLDMFNQTGGAIYSPHEWTMLRRFEDFWRTHKVRCIASELKLISKSMDIGGTLDMVVEFGGQRWLIDAKTSNAIRRPHYLQVAIYAKMWEEVFPDLPIHRIGIWHAKATTKGPAREVTDRVTGETSRPSIQGDGWRLVEPAESRERLVQLFDMCRTMWNFENPDAKPRFETLPTRLVLPTGTLADHKALEGGIIWPAWAGEGFRRVWTERKEHLRRLRGAPYLTPGQEQTDLNRYSARFDSELTAIAWIQGELAGTKQALSAAVISEADRRAQPLPAAAPEKKGWLANIRSRMAASLNPTNQ